ncbi:hypothetical protein HKX48_007207 [Thoreauomyces humboldtii]|nr:hypothetical protein HKX48_007207 [Thoreauomyces humboldtii]
MPLVPGLLAVATAALLASPYVAAQTGNYQLVRAGSSACFSASDNGTTFMAPCKLPGVVAKGLSLQTWFYVPNMNLLMNNNSAACLTSNGMQPCSDDLPPQQSVVIHSFTAPSNITVGQGFPLQCLTAGVSGSLSSCDGSAPEQWRTHPVKPNNVPAVPTPAPLPANVTTCTLTKKVNENSTCVTLSRSYGMSQASLLSLNPWLDCGALFTGQTPCVRMSNVTSCTSWSPLLPVGSTCASAVSFNKITRNDFLRLNPYVDCKQSLKSYSVCISDSAHPSRGTPVPPTPVPAPPTPVALCGKRNAATAAQQTCNTIAPFYGIQMTTLEILNPQFDCSSPITVGTNLCTRPYGAPACGTWLQVIKGQTCEGIASSNNLTMSALMSLIPAASCPSIDNTWRLCVKVGVEHGSTGPKSFTAAAASAKIVAPSTFFKTDKPKLFRSGAPNSNGLRAPHAPILAKPKRLAKVTKASSHNPLLRIVKAAGDCQTASVVDNCWDLATAAGISLDQLQSFNPGLDCSAVSAGQLLCTGPGNMPAHIDPSLDCGPYSGGKKCEEGCCSSFGYCGIDQSFCATPAQGGGCVDQCMWPYIDPQAECGKTSVGNKACPLNTCCSEWGYCSSDASFCELSQGCQGNCGMPSSLPSCSPNPSSFIRIGYYGGWAAEGKGGCGMPIGDIPYNLYTHMYYSFGGINPDFTISMEDGEDKDLRTMIADAHSQGVKAVLSLGGWSFNDPGPTQGTFSRTASSDDNRRAFCGHAIDFVNSHGLDGLDIDWEYPVADDRNGLNAYNPNDTSGLVALMQTCKSMFGGKLLTIHCRQATGISAAYDMHGTWDATESDTGPYVRPHTAKNEIETSLVMLQKAGVGMNKIVLGLAYYGRSFTLSNPSCDSLMCPFVSGGTKGRCTDEEGFLSYFEIKELMAQNGISQPSYFNADINAAYVTWGNQWVSFDDPKTIRSKTIWAMETCMAEFVFTSSGAFKQTWAVDLDDIGSDQRKSALGIAVMAAGGLSIPAPGLPSTPLSGKAQTDIPVSSNLPLNNAFSFLVETDIHFNDERLTDDPTHNQDANVNPQANNMRAGITQMIKNYMTPGVFTWPHHGGSPGAFTFLMNTGDTVGERPGNFAGHNGDAVNTGENSRVWANDAVTRFYDITASTGVPTFVGQGNHDM